MLQTHVKFTKMAEKCCASKFKNSTACGDADLGDNSFFYPKTV